MHPLKRKYTGFTLIELLIGLSIGLVVSAGLITFFMATSKSTTQTIQSIRLEYELQAAVDLMVSDIRRAGFYGSSQNMVNSGANTNPFMAANTDISVPISSCILLTYDLSNDGSIPALNTSNSDERFGYRLSNQTIQARSPTDSVFSCSSGNWDDITNPSLIEVTDLTFTLTENSLPLDSPSTGSIVLRQVTITATARLASDNTVSRTVSSQVRVRNDKYVP